MSLTHEQIMALDKHYTIRDFITESNDIEGIHQSSNQELQEFKRFINLEKVEVEDVVKFVHVFAGERQKLRVTPGLNVRVGNYVAPPGGPEIYEQLEYLLSQTDMHPHELYCRYEMLHPFTDGNGRSGRALWFRQMELVNRGVSRNLLFLKQFHYQSLEKYRL